jgi:outer membrane protein assembly factor BamB
LTSLGFLAALPWGQPQGQFKPSPEDAWSQFRGNHQLTGVASSVPSEELKLVWTHEAGDSIESSAVIVDGAVFVGSYSGELIALELSSGKVLWTYRAKDAIGESSPAVRDGRVFIGDLSGTLHAVNARNGKGLWTYETESEVKSSPVIVSDRVLIGSYDEHLHCLSVRDGSLLWKFQTEGPVHCTVGVSGGVAYVAGCDEFFRGVRISDGKEILKVASGGYTGASPALKEKTAYFGTFNNEVVAVDLASRRIAWRYQHPRRHFPFYSSAAITDGTVVVGGRDKMVHGLDAKTGKARWTFFTRGRVESSPAIAGGRVYVGSNDGRLYVLDLAGGEKLWEFNAGSPLPASPAIAAGYVVIGAQDGRLYCFR